LRLPTDLRAIYNAANLAQTRIISDEDWLAKELVESSISSLLGDMPPQIVTDNAKYYEELFRQGFAQTAEESAPQFGIEREKKYLVSPDAIDDLTKILNDPVELTQIYLSDHTNLRVRKVVDANGKTTYLATLKGNKIIDEAGKVIRHEVECEITAPIFQRFADAELPRVEKTRWRNALLPCVTLDVFKSSDLAILESEDVDGISPLRTTLIRIFQDAHTNAGRMIQSTKDEVDNHKIALAAFGDQAADYVECDDIIRRVFSQADEQAQRSELLAVVSALA
jgi:hypothetical protein